MWSQPPADDPSERETVADQNTARRVPALQFDTRINASRFPTESSRRRTPVP